MTAFTLKIIALLAMLIDNMAVVFPDYFPFWFRCIGRLAWPIFAYLIAEGFRNTKAPDKFLLRLIIQKSATIIFWHDRSTAKSRRCTL